MSYDPEALYQLSRELIGPSLERWLAEIAREHQAPQPEPSSTERAA